ncbi:MAG: divergent polysaccharide deacetylase family protein [Alphaproteobacteria bacterium]
MPDRGFSPEHRRGRRGNPLALAFFALLAALAALLALIALTGDPRHGEPSVSLALKPKPAAGPAPMPAKAQPRLMNGQVVADPALLESSEQGQLPIVSADGRKPMQVYARAFDADDPRPRIVIVIGGLGMSVTATKLALTHLPPAVTLSFAPYASKLQPWVDAARGIGHEVLIEVPMEPMDYPKSDPGPHTLLTAAGSAENTRRLYWALSRATGYVGVTNLLGRRFLSDVAAAGLVMAELERRGLLFFDNGGFGIIRTGGAPAVRSKLVLDAIPDRRAIEAKLSELESLAREKGSASASGIVYPVTIQVVSEWATGLEARGLVLAPVSALASAPSAAPEASAE